MIMAGSNLLKRLMTVYFFTLAAAPISYLIRILYARGLSVEAYGAFYAVLAFIGLIGMFNDLGMNPALVYYLPKFIKERSFSKIRSAVSLVAGIELLSSVVVLAVIFILREFLAEHFFRSEIALIVLPIFAFVFLFENIFTLMNNIFKGYRKELFYSSMNPFRLLSVLIFSFIFYLLFDQNLVMTFSLIWVLSFLFSIVVYAFPLAKTAPELIKHKISFSRPTSSKLFRYGFFVMFSSVAGMVLGRLDVLMLTYFEGVASVGLYEIALPLATIILVAIKPVTSFLFPNISYFYHSNQLGEIKAIIQALYNTGLFLFLPLGLIFFLFPQEIIVVLFGAKYAPAKIALKILAIGFIFRGFSSLNFSITDGIGQVKKKGYLIYLGAGLNIILNLILIPLYSIEGAALATSISFFFMFAASLVFLIRKMHFIPAYRNWLKIMIDCLLFISLIYLLKTWLDMNIYLETALVVGTAGIIYIAIGFIWRIIDYNAIKQAATHALKK
ncbi:oligosaccharide flippase family protein [Candidatus Woesearchaeota archaeon]|nr:oligosaccharide flippase family protein [Candidatus Woesearchaeota archaeon]